MNCPVHTKEQMLFVHNISLHHTDGISETLPLYECKRCNQYYISSKSLHKDFTRKLQNGKTVKNFYDNPNSQSLQKNNKEPSSYVDHIGPDKKKIHVYLYQKGFSKICPRCHITLLALKITYPSKKGIRYIYGKKCPSCEMNYLHKNNYLTKKEYFSVENKEIINNLSFEKNSSNVIQKPVKKNKEKTNVTNVNNSNMNSLGRATISKTTNVILDKDEIRYLMCELFDIRTRKPITITITSSNVSRVIDETHKIITVGSELGQLCLKAVANDIEVINYMNVTYSINRFARYDIPYVETYRDKSFKRLSVKTDEYPMDPKQIDKKVVYVYLKLNNSCLRNKHNVENVTMYVTNIRDNRKINVNVFHCSTCGKYFINYEQLKEYIDKKQIPAFKYSIVKGTIDSLNEISELMLYGYSVKEGALKESERQGILAWILDCNLMTKNQIINNIQYKIDYNGKKESNAKAKIKWEDDLAFVAGYRLNTQARLQGKVVWK